MRWLGSLLETYHSSWSRKIGRKNENGKRNSLPRRWRDEDRQIDRRTYGRTNGTVPHNRHSVTREVVSRRSKAKIKVLLWHHRIVLMSHINQSINPQSNMRLIIYIEVEIALANVLFAFNYSSYSPHHLFLKTIVNQVVSQTNERSVTSLHRQRLHRTYISELPEGRIGHFAEPTRFLIVL